MALDELANAREALKVTAELKGINDALTLQLHDVQAELESAKMHQQPVVVIACTLRPRLSLVQVPVQPTPLMEKQSRAYKACDVGIRVKMHLHWARSLWEQGVRLVLLGNKRAVSRTLGIMHGPANVNRESYENEQPLEEFETIDMSDTLPAPEYALLIPQEEEYEGQPNRMVPITGGFYEPFPIWIHGRPNPALFPHMQGYNPEKMQQVGALAVLNACKHLRAAALIATSADKSDRWCLEFLTREEMHALVSVRRLTNVEDDSDKSYVAKRGVYSEILRYLVSKHDATDLRDHYQRVVATIGSPERVKDVDDFLVRLNETLALVVSKK